MSVPVNYERKANYVDLQRQKVSFKDIVYVNSILEVSDTIFKRLLVLNATIY